ncbi:MAG: PEP-CTERM sorting domain-containing protein [Bryobacteraceae bacterium]
MRRIFALTFLAAATTFAGSLTIDSFSDDQGPLTISNLDPTSPKSDGPVAVSDDADDRTLMITGIGPVNPFSNVVQVAGGGLDITNGTGDDSTVVVTYNLPLLAIPLGASNVQLFLTIVDSDGNPTNVQLGGVAAGNFAIPGNTSNQTVAFNVAGPPVGPGQLTLTFDGAPGWDLNVDSLGLRWTDPPQTGVPEPGSMLLIGLGISALGLLRRRAA